VREEQPIVKGSNEIVTARLRLRRPLLADAEAIFRRFASSHTVTKYLGWPRHETIRDTEAFLAFSEEQWKTWPAGPYLVTARDTGALLGSSGLSFRGAHEAVTGYVLAEDASGHGYATETLHAIIELARALSVRELRALCHPGHIASQRVLEKCGFRSEGTGTIPGAFPNLSGDAPAPVLHYVRSCL
jgi:ribosomal-protein-alanine N-acetyltransferase